MTEKASKTLSLRVTEAQLRWLRIQAAKSGSSVNDQARTVFEKAMEGSEHGAQVELDVDAWTNLLEFTAHLSQESQTCVTPFNALRQLVDEQRASDGAILLAQTAKKKRRAPKPPVIEPSEAQIMAVADNKKLEPKAKPKTGRSSKKKAI